MVAAIAGSSGTDGGFETVGVDGAIVALVVGSTGGGVRVATVTSLLTVGIAPPQFPQKRCEPSTGPPQCGHVIVVLATPLGYEVSHYEPNAPGKQWSGRLIIRWKRGV
jgi:hypothetical protein